MRGPSVLECLSCLLPTLLIPGLFVAGLVFVGLSDEQNPGYEIIGSACFATFLLVQVLMCTCRQGRMIIMDIWCSTFQLRDLQKHCFPECMPEPTDEELAHGFTVRHGMTIPWPC